MRICNSCGVKHGKKAYTELNKVARCEWCRKVLPTVDAQVYGLANAKVHHLGADNASIQR